MISNIAIAHKTCEESLRVCDEITNNQLEHISNLKIDLNREKFNKRTDGVHPILYIVIGLAAGTALGILFERK